MKQSAADGDQVVFLLTNGPKCDSLAVNIDGAPIAEVVLQPFGVYA